MLDFIANQLKKKGVNPDKANMPKHIAMTVGGLGRWSRKTGEDLKEAHKKAFKKVEEIIRYQLAFDIPIISLYLINSKVNQAKDFTEIMDALGEFFRELAQNKDIFRQKVKISIIGKWYDLPSRVVEPMKRVIDETKDYDSFFLNLCINYDGQEEIVDACKIIVRKAMIEKMDIDTIDVEMVKDNIYSSYFLPPDMIIKTGTGKRLHGFLLWDSSQSMIYFSGITWIDFREKDLIRAIRYYQDNRNRV
ncbi:di-trans,poly-cis-decaprenylcistransferase [Candidatus Woesearchaeota archaeon]|nr:di-trans,poly-cis-decaprenylcistransferase [Candidatus Woesearchaeota archaeon]